MNAPRHSIFKTSLVAKWAADFAHQGWPGCDAVFAWSFYSQGTRGQTAVSSDLFLAEAVTFFGDEAMAKSAAGAFDKGRRLAQLVGERRALLILDGLEPLQYPPTSTAFPPGELKDKGIGKLLCDLAATSHGRTVREEKLARLARAAGVQLLKAHGVTGSDRRNLPLHDGDAKSELVSEFEKLAEDVDGHALTLHIMGSFLKKAFGGDIRKRDRVTFAKASQKTDNGHAFRAMAAYARWMEDGSDEARRELAILRLMGLFDRPATADCLAALLAAPRHPRPHRTARRPARGRLEWQLRIAGRRETALRQPGVRFRSGFRIPSARFLRRAPAPAGIFRNAVPKPRREPRPHGLRNPHRTPNPNGLRNPSRMPSPNGAKYISPGQRPGFGRK